MRKLGFLLLTLLLALALVACGGDDAEDDQDATANTDASTAEDAGTEGASGFNPSGPSVSLGGGLGDALGEMPGCSDPDDEECPAALSMTLDGSATVDGVTISYPERYFDALTGDDAGGALIRIVPSENNKYVEDAIFTVAWGESIEAAVAELEAPDSAEWSTETLTGTIAVSKDQEQDPPVNTTVGAFTTEDGRVLLFNVTTTGKYGWDLWMNVYSDMLDTLTVSAASAE